MSVFPDRLTAALSDRYRIERELGQGGMATVYLAQDLKHDRQVAIKVLRPELAAVIGAERFLAEIKTTANLQHPHILPLFDSGAADSFLFYVMPFVAGISLRDRMTREKQLPIAEAVRIASEVAAALDYAHRHGVIHRDIKPENIMLHDGSALVADFGIALAASKAGSRMTETGMSLGTPQYMSPEQAMGERELDARSDVYALGCVTYEMLTGEPPFSGPTAQAIVAKVMTAEAVEATTLRKTIPAHVADAVHGALQKLPADRFASARDYAAALGGEGQRAGGPAGRRATAAHPVAGPSGRRAVPAALAAALLLTAALAAWGWLRPEPPAPVSRFSIVLPPNHVLRFSQASRVTVARDGSAFLYAGASPAGTGIFLRTRESRGPEMIPGTAGAVNPEFSHDGQQVAFVQGQPRAIRVVSLAGGVPRTLADSLVDLGGMSWGYDGHIYYDGHLDGDGLARVRESGGPPQPVTRADSAQGELWHFQPEALPNGRGVLFTVNKGGILGRWFVAVTEIGTGSHRILLEGSSPRYASGYLFYMTREGVMMGVAFDQGRLELQGDPQPVIDDVGVFGLARTDFAISTTGTVVYLSAAAWTGDTELVWVTRGGVVTAVDTAWRRPMTEISLAPDGRRVAVTLGERRQSDIWVKSLDQGAVRRISSDGPRNWSPIWLPGGQELLFVSSPWGQAVPRGGVMRARTDGSQLPQVFREGLQPDYPSVTRDGQWLLLDIGGNIHAARLEGDTVLTEPIPQEPSYEVAPAVSPDGRWLGYLSDGKGMLQLVVRPFPSTGGGSHTVSPEGAINWAWSRDGRELYYQTEAGDLMAAEVLPGAAFAIGDRRLLFNLEQLWPGGPVDWKPAPDGTRFLMLRPVRPEGRPDELIVIDNFLTEVRAKVPR